MWCVARSEAAVVAGRLLPLAVSNKLMLPGSRTNPFLHKKGKHALLGQLFFILVHQMLGVF